MKSLITVILFSFFFAVSINAQWMYVTPPEIYYGGNYVVSHDGDLYFANNEDIWKTTDEGNNWTNLTNGFVQSAGNANIVIQFAGNNIFVGTFTIGIFMSPDMGATWQIDTTGLEGSYNCHIIFTDGTNIFSSFDYPTYGFYMKAAAPGAWTRVNSNSIGSGYNTNVKGMTKINNTLYAATRNSGIFESTDNGITWNQKTNSGLPSPVDGQFADRLLNIGPDLFVSTDNGIYKSTDQAESWIRVDQGFAVWDQFNVTQIWAMYTDGTNLYASVAQDDSAYVSENGGNTWNDISNGLHHRIKSFTMHNGHLFAAQWDIDSSIVRYGGATGVKSEDAGVPEKFELSQNYPNPFNPTTNIKFRIPDFTKVSSGRSDFGFVTLKVYTALGEEVTVLINEEKKPGIYNVNFDGKNLSSGIYFYQLKADNFVETKKMILLR